MATIAIDDSGLEATFSLTEGGPGSSVMKRLQWCILNWARDQ
jgi:hypothetical protein